MARMKEEFLNNLHICSYCDSQYVELLDLLAHMKEQHKWKN